MGRMLSIEVDELYPAMRQAYFQSQPWLCRLRQEQGRLLSEK